MFEHVLRVRAHPQFFGLELRAPMDACSGLYGILDIIALIALVIPFLGCLIYNNKRKSTGLHI